MYKVKMDGHILYSPVYPQAVLTDPQLELEMGYAGIFTASIPPENPMYDMVHCRRSMVSVFQDEKEIFYGEVRKLPKTDRYRNKEIYCVGALSFLADTIQPQAEYHDMTPYGMLKRFLDIHNEQVEDRKKIRIGEVTVTDPNDSLYRFTNFETTLEAVREKLVSRLGGVLRLRHTEEGLFLDWIHVSEYGKYNTQPVEFGLNLLDYSETLTAEDIVTALIPLGAKLETDEEEVLERYTDITSVNDGKDHIINEAAVEQFGYIWAVNHWDDVTLPSNLKAKGEQWLSETQYETMTLSLTAADLSGIGQDYEAFGEGDMVHCLAKPYGCDIVLPVQKLVIPLQKPAERKLELSSEREKTYTERQTDTLKKTIQDAEEKQFALNQRITESVNNLTAIVRGTSGGYKLTEYDENGLWLRDLYMDAPDVEKAVNILQISKEGIAGSTSGYEGPYTVGMLLNGTIVGSQIAANSIDTDQLSIGLNTWIRGTEDGIASKVEKDGIVSAINQSSEAIVIDASKINLNGYVTLTSLKDGKTVIDGGNILTGTIAADRIAAGCISSDKLSVGVNATIQGLEDGLETRVEKDKVVSSINQSSEAVTIDASKINLNGYVTLTSLKDGKTVIDGGNILTGTIAADRIATGSISSDKLSVGVNTTIQGLEDGLETRVEKDKVVSAINQTSESVTIDASKINLNGAITANGNVQIGIDGKIKANNAQIAGAIHTFTSFDEDYEDPFASLEDRGLTFRIGNLIVGMVSNHAASGDKYGNGVTIRSGSLASAGTYNSINEISYNHNLITENLYTKRGDAATRLYKGVNGTFSFGTVSTYRFVNGLLVEEV